MYYSPKDDTMNRPLGMTALALILASGLLAGCAAAETPTTRESDSPAASATPPATPPPTPTPEPAAATCENTVTAETLAAFQAVGWTAGKSDDPWYIVEDFPAGISCTWGDYSIASDNVSWLAWAPVPDAQAEGLINALLAQGGWVREDGAEGVYITAADSDMMPMTDAEGYATTYLFADGQVKAATTKSELVAITAPPGFTP